MRPKVAKYLLFLLIIILISAFFVFKKNHLEANRELSAEESAPIEEKAPEIQDKRQFIEIGEKDTYGALMEEAIGVSLSHAVYYAASSTYDLAKIKLGRQLELTFEKDSDVLKQVVYKIDSEDELAVQNSAYYENASSTGAWFAFIRPIAYEVRLATKGGNVESSMYQAALDNGIDERAIIELANAFQWTIDFAMDPRVGDDFKFVYEERYLDGKYVMPGRIMAGYYVNDGERYEVYYFEESEENKGYFDAGGNSTQKMFLKAPVAFKYISSGFTTGARYIEAFDISTGHRAVDYAAALGTPIRAVGDGTITMASWGGSYGNKISIRHNGTYSTNYAHLSRFAVKKGNKVKQGDVIGYVGSTGLSTGPHLHYEMVKDGTKVNPLREVLPPGAPIKEENKERFAAEMEKWKEMLAGSSGQ